MLQENPQALAERIAEGLEGKRVGASWKARCPAHADEVASMSISVKGEHVLVHCFAGCEQGDLIAVLKAKGLWPEGAPERERSSNEPVARYLYKHPETGETLAYKERIEWVRDGKREKRGVWYRPNGDKGLAGTKVYLYRIEKIKDTSTDVPILFVEGEKCVRSAERLGFVAVSGHAGAETRVDDRWLHYLKGRLIWLLPDNDEPGRKHMRAVEAALKTAGIPSRWVELPGLPDKGDIADWAAAGGTREQLLALAAEAGSSPSTAGTRLLTVSMREVQLEDVHWLWHPYVPLGKFTLMEGDPGVRKSWLALAISSAVSLGVRLPFDRSDRGPARVLLLAGEDGLGDTVKPRLLAMGADLDRIRSVTGLLKEDEEQPMTLSAEGIAALVDEVASFRPALVIIDPLVAYTSRDVDMNKANEVRSMLRPLTDMAQRQGVAIIALRHLNKVAGSAASYRGQGSIDYFAISRSVLFVGQDKNDRARSIMAPNKSSLTEKGPGIAFRLGPGPHGAEFLWDGQVDTTVEELLATPDEPEQQSALEEAKTYLQEVLHDGPAPGREVQRSAKDAGVSERTLWRAKSELHVKATKQSGVSGQWVWALPLVEDPAMSANSANPALRAQSWQDGRHDGVGAKGYRDSDDQEELGF